MSSILEKSADLDTVIDTFEGITLDDMNRVKLMSRIDTKYVLHESTLVNVLNLVLDDYQALMINDIRALLYETDYYDTEHFKLYTHHHNGRVNRKKIRTRKYCESGIGFLEVKAKDNTGKTDKTRVQKDKFDFKFDEKEKDFLTNSPLESYKGLLYSLRVKYRRLTLAHKTKCERVTIDFGLSCERPEVNLRKDITSDVKKFDMNNLVIVEVKQERYSRDSEIMQALKNNEVREMRMSKYCMGCAAVYPELKQNAFKEKMIYINKLKNMVID